MCCSFNKNEAHQVSACEVNDGDLPAAGRSRHKEKLKAFVSESYLLGAWLLQQHAEAARVLLVVGDELSQRGERDLIRDEVRSDGGALDPEVEHFPLAPSCNTEGGA